jgi:hypothetical protein
MTHPIEFVQFSLEILPLREVTVKGAKLFYQAMFRNIFLQVLTYSLVVPLETLVFNRRDWNR